MGSNRIRYIDIAKGIGILLVALAHADISIFAPYAHRLIYSFHMPLFFFLSGYFLSTKLPFWKTVVKRFHTILKPYFVMIPIIYLGAISFSNMRFVTVFGRILKFMYASGYYIDWVQLWFLPSLFVTSLFSYLLYRFALNRFENRFIRWGILLAVQALAVMTVDAFYPFSLTLFGKEYELYGLPYSLDLLLLSSFFYCLGSEIRNLSVEKLLEKTWFLLATGASLALLVFLFAQRVDFNTRTFESFPINTVEAILGILFTLAVSKQIDLRAPRLASALTYTGQASLFILIFHVPIQDYWSEKLNFVLNVEPVSILSAFLVSVLISLGIYRFFFEKNPIALFWFGRRSAIDSEQN